MNRIIRIFISSPGDVGREREATRRVIDRLQSEFAEHVTLDPYFWEWEPVDFSHDYQSQIPSTADFEIVICLLWSKLGSRLDDQYKLPPDYTETAGSGTQYELMQALHGKQQHPQSLPDLLVWVNKAPPPPASAPPLSRKEEDELIKQRRALQDFLASITRDTSTGIFTAAVNRYQVPGDDFDSYQYLDEFEDMMDRKLRKLIQKHIGGRTVKPKAQWQGSPFRDLDVFDFEHERIFFGRSRAIGEVVRLLQNTLNKPEHCHFALVLGASGSGKSSLARAGVLPLLTRPGVIEGIGLWRCAIVRPSDDSNDLFLALASALLRNESDKPGGCLAALPELADAEADDPQQSLGAELRAHPQSVAIRVKDQLNSIAKAHRTQQSHALEAQIASLTKDGRQADASQKRDALQQLQDPKARLVLLLDQMEELFTLNYAPEQLRAFLETIDVLARSGRVFVFATLRSDFYHRFQNPIPSDKKTLTTLVDLARDGARFDLLPPTPDEISQIIRSPARLAGLEFEPHPTIAEHTLADTLRDEALADPESLPLLEHVLNRLYEAQLSRADGRLNFADHTTLGGVGGALGKHAEDIFTGQNFKPDEPPPPWTEYTFRAVFGCLVTFGKGDGDADVPNRRAFAYDDLIKSEPAAQSLVDTFIRERLFTADKDVQSRAIVRLSHEALLTRWPRLCQWLQTAPVRDLMSQRRRLESSLRQWQEQNRTPDCYLQPGFELEEGKLLLEKHEAALKTEEREFIRDSLKYHADRERNATRRRRLVFTVLSMLTLFASVGGWYGQWQASKAKASALDADKQRTAAQIALAESNRQLERSQVEEGRAWLERGRAALNKGDHLSALMLAGRAIGYHGYGRRTEETKIFSESFPSLLGFPMNSRAVEKERENQKEEVEHFIDSLEPTNMPLWFGPTASWPWCIAFSPDSTCFASASEGGTIKLWDSSTGRETLNIPTSKTTVRSIAFSPDGTHLVGGLMDGTIKLWNASTGSVLRSFSPYKEAVYSVAFSPDGKWIAGSSLKEIKLWDSENYSELVSLDRHLGYVMGVAFCSDGSRLASCSHDGKIKIWNPILGVELFSVGPLPAQDSRDNEGIWSVALSGDGKQLASGDNNGIMRLWDTATMVENSKIIGHTDVIYDIAFSPDGTCIATCSGDGMVKFWDQATGKEICKLDQGQTTRCISFSPDGSRFCYGSDKNQIVLLDAAKKRELYNIPRTKNFIRSVAFSPDGTRIASGEYGVIRIWDSVVEKEIANISCGSSIRGNSLIFSPDSLQIAGITDNGEVKIWNTLTGKCLVIIPRDIGFPYQVAFTSDNKILAGRFEGNEKTIVQFDATSGAKLASTTDLQGAHWIKTAHENCDYPYDRSCRVIKEDDRIFIKQQPYSRIDLSAPLRSGLLTLPRRELQFPEVKHTTPMLHVRQDTLAQLADPNLTPERRTELRMELCAKSSQFRAATALWQRLLQGEWPGFEGATVPKDQAPATIPADSPIRRLYLLALIDATKRPQIHGHPTICQTAAQIAPVLTKEMMATPTISLAMMSLMQTLAKDDSPNMSAPRAELLKRLEEVASTEWLAVLRESTSGQ